MRLFLAIAVCCLNLPLQGQQAEETGPAGNVSLTGGPIAQSIILPLSKPPAPGDSITVNVPTKQVGIALVTPRGQRITAANAARSGFDWLQYAQKLPLGSDDAGAAAVITFTQAASAGQYRIELTSVALRTPLRADAHFTSRMDDYTRLVRSSAGAQMSEPVALGRAAVVRLKLAQSATQTLLDIVVPDSAVDVTLTLPNGHVLSARQPPERSVDWQKIEVLHGEENPGSMLLAMGVLMPLDGTHYVVGLEKAEPGLYAIHATRANPGAGQLRVAMMPLESLVRAKHSREDALNRPPVGAVKIHPKPLPSEGFAGDKLELVVSLAGDAGTASPTFEVRIERQAKLRDTGTGIQYASPDPVETRPAEFTRTADGIYHGWVILPDPGHVRIAVRANGTTAAGKPFTDEAIATNEFMIVKPVVAHFRSLSASAAGPNGDSKFDRLEVSAELDVIEPGDYAMFFTLRDAAGTSLPGGPAHGSAKLLAGLRTLTVSVPASKIWSELRDGPFEIPSIQIWRTQPNASSSSWVDVPTGGASLRTAAYTRNQWNPGPFYGEDRVSVHGLRPAPSGRFRFAEVEWEVTTPGGACRWDGSLGGNIITPGGPIPLEFHQERDLPAGRTKLSFLVEGSLIAASPKRNPLFSAVIHCATDPGKEGVRPPTQVLALNPSEYEPTHASFLVQARSPLRLYPGSSGSTFLMVPNKTASQVHFALHRVPQEFEIELVGAVRSPESTAWVSLQATAKAGTRPGRYYIAVDATCQGETETAEVVIDVIARAAPGMTPAKIPNPPHRAAGRR